MPISFYDLTVGTHVKGLYTLAHLLSKAKAYAEAKSIPIDELLEWRLIEDMLPFRFQVQTTCNAAKNAMKFCAGLDMPAVEDNEKTFADLEARVASTIEILKGIKREDVEGKEDLPTNPPEAVKKYGDFKGAQLFLGYSNLNFYFHLATAYDILRSKGVDVGKRDWLKGGQ